MTNDEFLNLIVEYLNGLQLPGALSVLSGGLARMESREAQGVAQIAMAAATAAQSDTAKLVRLLRGAASYFNQVETNVSNNELKYGIETDFVFTGAAAPETITNTLTGLTWVTADTVTICFPPPPETSAVEYLYAYASNYVAGTGFDISASCGTVTSSTYSVVWLAFPNGYNS